MKVIITETQYRKLQRHLRKQELNEASFGKNFKNFILPAALSASLALGSPEARGQDYDYVRSNSDSTKTMMQSINVEPTGKWSFPTDYGGKRDKVFINNNILYITSPTQIADILRMVSAQYDSIVIPINSETNRIIKNYMIDSSYGGKNNDGYYFVPKGVRSEDDIYDAKLAKKVLGILKGTFGKNVRLPIKEVNMSDDIVELFIELVKSEQTPFNIKRDRNGREVIYKEFDYN
jgi:hypothetical protein